MIYRLSVPVVGPRGPIRFLRLRNPGIGAVRRARAGTSMTAHVELLAAAAGVPASVIRALDPEDYARAIAALPKLAGRP